MPRRNNGLLGLSRGLMVRLLVIAPLGMAVPNICYGLQAIG
jgi:hypothetical protein